MHLFLQSPAKNPTIIYVATTPPFANQASFPQKNVMHAVINSIRSVIIYMTITIHTHTPISLHILLLQDLLHSSSAHCFLRISKIPHKLSSLKSLCGISFFSTISYNSQLFTVLGNGITSRIFAIPVKYMTQRSNPSPNPACLAEPYFLRSR